MKKIDKIFKRFYTNTKEIYDFTSKVKINIPQKSKVLEFHPIWLRHHCQCEKCLNAKTFQKMLIPSHLPSSSFIQDFSTSLKSLQVKWSDGHVSTFSLKSLEETFTKILKIKEKPKKSPSLPYNYNDILPKPKDPLENSVSYQDFMSSEEGVANLLRNIVQHGYGIVVNAPHSYKDTKEIVLRISHPQNTIYGGFSEWTSNLEHADTAYTSDHVHLHTDTSYFTEPMGLQMFHCLKHEGSGGINSIVDGFQVAKDFHKESESLHDILSTEGIRSQYLDPGKHHYLSEDLTLKHNSLTGAIEKIRYNPHDIGTIDTIHLDLLPNFYKALVEFSKNIESCPVWLKLNPGLVIFLDNWRVLHGRSEFTGFRHLCGAYIGRSDWLSRARVLQVIK